MPLCCPLSLNARSGSCLSCPSSGHPSHGRSLVVVGLVPVQAALTVMLFSDPNSEGIFYLLFYISTATPLLRHCQGNAWEGYWFIEQLAASKVKTLGGMLKVY